MRRSAFNVALVLALCLTLAFFLLPIAAVFLRVPPGELLSQLGSGVVLDALVVTAKTSLVAQAIIFLVGTPAAYLVARRRFRGRAVVLTAIELPLVLPPRLRASACWPRSGGSGCSAARSTSWASRSASRRRRS